MHSVASGVLLLDKPPGITSTRALALARRALAIRKAGHTGTLDPFATGLLPLVFGEATKFSRFLLDATKSYEATLLLGAESSTGDVEGVVSPTGAPLPDPGRIDEVLDRFTGAQAQVPPMHSALRQGGRRLYEYAREGKVVARAPREVEVSRLERIEAEGERLRVSVTCSKGTYIRVLAEEIGRALGCGAYLVALRRTAVGSLRIEEAVPLSAIESEGVAARRRLLAPEILVAELPRKAASEVEAARFAHGQPIAADDGALGEGEVAVFGPLGSFIGVGRSTGAGRIEPLRLMAPQMPESPDFA